MAWPGRIRQVVPRRIFHQEVSEYLTRIKSEIIKVFNVHSLQVVVAHDYRRSSIHKKPEIQPGCCGSTFNSQTEKGRGKNILFHPSICKSMGNLKVSFKKISDITVWGCTSTWLSSCISLSQIPESWKENSIITTSKSIIATLDQRTY